MSFTLGAVTLVPRSTQGSTKLGVCYDPYKLVEKCVPASERFFFGDIGPFTYPVMSPLSGIVFHVVQVSHDGQILLQTPATRMEMARRMMTSALVDLKLQISARSGGMERVFPKNSQLFDVRVTNEISEVVGLGSYVSFEIYIGIGAKLRATPNSNYKTEDGRPYSGSSAPFLYHVGVEMRNKTEGVPGTVIFGEPDRLELDCPVPFIYRCRDVMASAFGKLGLVKKRRGRKTPTQSAPVTPGPDNQAVVSAEASRQLSDRGPSVATTFHAPDAHEPVSSAGEAALFGSSLEEDPFRFLVSSDHSFAPWSPARESYVPHMYSDAERDAAAEAAARALALPPLSPGFRDFM